MTVGTKSVLFGSHQFLLHPWFVAAAWWKLYGFPWDPRLWVAFFVHDLGYWGKPNMDGEEGERHVLFGANVMGLLFDKILGHPFKSRFSWQGEETILCSGPRWDWYIFCLYHSRFWAKKCAQPVSRLCLADKLAICYTPWWLYIPLATASGEIYEYMRRAKSGKRQTMNVCSASKKEWYVNVQEYLYRWVYDYPSRVWSARSEPS